MNDVAHEVYWHGATVDSYVPQCPGCRDRGAPTASPILRAARLAAAALTQALDTERRAADEVEARGSERSARIMLDTDRQSAAVALGALAALLPPHRVAEAAEMADGAARGFAREKWALRVVAIAAEAEGYVLGQGLLSGCGVWMKKEASGG